MWFTQVQTTNHKLQMKLTFRLNPPVFIFLDFLDPNYLRFPFFINYIGVIIIVSFVIVEIMKFTAKCKIKSLTIPPENIRKLENHEIEIILSIINKALDAEVGLKEFY